MLIGLRASYPGVVVRFRAVGTQGVVERSVELSWEEAQELLEQLNLMLSDDFKHIKQHPDQRELEGC